MKPDWDVWGERLFALWAALMGIGLLIALFIGVTAMAWALAHLMTR